MNRVSSAFVMWADAMHGNATRQLERLFDRVRVEVTQLDPRCVDVRVDVRHRDRDYGYSLRFPVELALDCDYYAHCLRDEYPRRVVREVTDYILRGV